MKSRVSEAEEPMKTVQVPLIADEDGFHESHILNAAMEDEVELPKFDSKPSHEAKLRELLRNISSTEIKLCAFGSKEFIKILRSSLGGELLHQYVRTSSKFTELFEAWSRWRGKPGLSYILSLIHAILAHPQGKYMPNDPNRVAISRVLDKFSRSIIEEKLDDLYKELNSKEGKRQKAALLLMGSIVRRGSLLAAEMAKSFDFKLPIVPKLSEYRRKQLDRRKKHSTRGAFVEFVMSFLESGKPALLRWVLQQREIFSGILRGLGNDDDETVVYVLSTLRDRVLITESLVAPSLRSVLFGSVTLEQLVGISARQDGELAPKLAYEVLVMVCTDPSNGLMPDLERRSNPLKGNQKRLLDLMKKLRATEVVYHRDLLLAIVNGNPLLSSPYLDEFPYNLEDNSSPTWLSAVTLAANVVRSVRSGMAWDFLVRHTHGQITFQSAEVQNVFKCICPRPFSRLVVNKGLLHSDPLVKHATLKLVLEVLKLLESFIDALNVNKLCSLKQKVQYEVQVLLPDPQVLFTLLSPISSTYHSTRSALKRRADSESIGQSKYATAKKLKVDVIDEDIDIIVGGLDDDSNSISLGETDKSRGAVTSSQLDDENDEGELMEIWGSDDSFSSDALKDAHVYFYCKVLDTLKIFHGALHAVLEVSYDVLKILPSNPLELPSILLESLLSMLMEHLGCSQDFSSSMLPPIYKHLQSFLSLSIQSSNKSIKEQAYVLAKASMRSTGAFDNNPWEIGAWLLFLPVCITDDRCGKFEEGQLPQSLSTPLISFLSDAVSTVGNNLVKYWALLKRELSSLEVVQGQKVNFSPLIVCVMEKCLRLLTAESGTFKLAEKSIISLYVCNTLKYLLQTQVEAETLAYVIHQFLSERIPKRICENADAQSISCEWRPLVHLSLFSQSILQRETFTCLFDGVASDTSSSFRNTIAEVKRLLSTCSTDVFALSKALYFTTVCTSADDVLANLPSVMDISGKLPGFHHYLMNYFYHDRSIMDHVSKRWPQIFSSGLSMSVIAPTQLRQDVDNQTLSNDASFVFGSCLKEVPFHILFPAIIFCDHEYYLNIKELLVSKLSNFSAEQSVSSVRLVLFWLHQEQLSYKKKPSKHLLQFFEICYVFVEHILAQLFALKVEPGSSATAGLPLSPCIEEVCITVFSHPAILAALSCSSVHHNKLSELLLTDSTTTLLHYCREKICKPELNILNLISTTCDYLVALCGEENSLFAYPGCKENILKAFRSLILWIIRIFKEKFSHWCMSGDITFLPVLYVILAFKRFISPAELLELANWMLAENGVSNSMLQETSSSSPTCLAFSIASEALDALAEYLQPLDVTAVKNDFFWELKKGSLDVALFKGIYCTAFGFATSLKLDLADVCLLKALNAAHSLSYRQEFLPLSMEMMRVIGGAPIELVSHCIHRTNITKAKLLFSVIKISSLHLLVFGCLFWNVLSKDFLLRVKRKNEPSLSDQDYLMLMPAAFSYISLSRTERIQSSSSPGDMLSFYSTILLDGFHNWKGFVSNTVFEVEYGDIMHSSVESLHDLFHSSLLGKAVIMLQWHFAVTGDDMRKRLNLFRSICPKKGQDASSLDDFLDNNASDVDTYSVGQLLNFLNRVIAKISLSLVLLFPENSENCLSNEANHEERVGFLDVLVSVWKWAVKKLPLPSVNCVEKVTDLVLRSLEVFTLRCISKLTMETQKQLIQMDSLPFVQKLLKDSLRYRFGDPSTLETLRLILSSLSEWKNMPVDLFLQLPLKHSQLSPTVCTLTRLSNCTTSGMVVKPVSSFLRSLVTPASNDDTKKCGKYKGQLEVIKLIKLLFHLKAQKGSVSGDELIVNWRELLLLFLSSYGATMSEIDLEIYGVVSQIESAKASSDSLVADMDYLWGSALLRASKEDPIKHLMLDGNVVDAEEDRRRSQFRDNLPIDFKLLTRTILYFPYERKISEKSLFSNSSQQDNIRNTVEVNSDEFGRIDCYDPVFILSFSIYSLSMGYLDPLEFAGLGLLAIALVSMASPEEGIRKLGYEVVWRLKIALEASQKKREAAKLVGLLAFLQNAIKDPWQKISSIVAVFVAEASVILLDRSNDHYISISKLVEKPQIHLESIPLFHDIMWSTSKNFRTDKIWMLRLLYVGINSEDDGHIVIRNGVPDILLSVYASPFSNDEEKDWILQVLKKCVKIQNLARYLIEKCSFLSWLSSFLSLSTSLDDGQDMFSSKQLIVLLGVIHEVVSSNSIVEWLEKYALEQLSDLSCHLFHMLVRCSKLKQEILPLVVIVLEVIILGLEISQKRKIYQPHFTPSLWSLYNLYQVVDQYDSEKSRCCSELGLRVILMSMPTTTILEMGQEELSQFLTWTVATAIRSDSSRGRKQEYSLMSILLRWLVASALLWMVSCSHDLDSSFAPMESKRETLLSLIESFENRCSETKFPSGSIEALTGTIFHLIQLIGVNCGVLPSVVAALSLLLLSDGSCSTGSGTAISCENHLTSLWSKVCYPPETNPSWRWSFYEPTTDLTVERTDIEKLDERHACQKLLVIISGKLRKKSPDDQLLSLEELESSGLFE